MYCNNCGSEMAEGAKFCSNCGTPMTAPVKPATSATPEPMHRGIDLTATEEAPRKPIFDEFQWNVEDYPERNLVEKTEDIDFNWNADPADILEPVRRTATHQEPVETISGINVGAALEAEPEIEDLHTSLFGQTPAEPEELSAAERIDKFYTFNKKNEEFQQLLNREYEKIKAGNVIGQEISEAEEAAEKRFESRPVDTSMEAFLEREGIVKPYQPKAFESDVLQRIEAQEAEKEAKRLEEEARLAAIEEARLEAEAKRKAEEARIAAEAEAKRRAEEEAARLAEIARRKAEEEAKAAEEARIRAEEEARLKAEEEARLKAEEEARLKAEAEARIKAEEEARLKAEADLKAAQEAAKIRAQQEARLAAEEEAKLKAEQERRAMEAAEAQRKLEEKRQRIAEEANHLAAEEEARKVLEQTNRMREEEAAKIRAAVASLRAGSSVAQAAETANAAGTAAKSAAVSKEVSEAHKATRNQINEMAKARNAYFAEMEEAEAKEADVKPAIRALKDDSAAVTGRATMLGDSDLGKTRVVDKRAIMAGLEGATRVSSKTVSAPAPASDEDFFNSLDAAAAAGVAGMVAEEIEEATNDIPEEPKEMDDLLSQFEIINHMDEELEEPVVIQEENTGLNDTVLMPQDEKIAGLGTNDFDNYGNEEAADYINKQRQQAQEEVYEEEEEQLSKKELKAREKEAKRLEKEKAKAEKAAAKKAKKNANVVNFEDEAEEDFEEEKGGKGRVVLKVILAILIIVLVLEVAGMAIKIFAPDSGAAEFIDTQFNKVLELIMGEEGDYNTDVIEIQAQDALTKITKA